MLSIIVSFVAGIVLSLAFPSMNAYWMAWFVVSPLMYFAFSQKWRTVVFCGFAFGVGFFGVLLSWMAEFGKIPCAIWAIHQALFIAGFVAAAKLLGQRLGSWGRFALLPCLWVGLEWIRSLGSFGFTFGDLGYSQYKILPIVQITAYTGVWGISLLMAACNTAVANLLAARGDRHGIMKAGAQLALVFTITAGIFVLGRVGMSHDPLANPVKVAIIQGNIDDPLTGETWAEYDERSWRSYTAMTLEAAKDHPDIIIWPETAVSGYAHDDETPFKVERLSDVTGSILLVGLWDQDSLAKMYNGVFLFAPQRGMVGAYAKVHLVPFGEYVPLRKYLTIAQQYDVPEYDASPGSGFEPMSVDDLHIGTAVCFESTFPYISRSLTRAGANMLCLVSSDRLFDVTHGAEQHMAFHVFRAVENRRWVMRGTTTGISCVVDPYGRIVSRLGGGRSGILHANIGRRNDITFYTRYGDLVLYFCLLVVVAGAWRAWQLRRAVEVSQ